MAEISDLIGKTLTKIERLTAQLFFYVGDEMWRMHHKQDCCEQVTLEDVAGDFEDLVGVPLLVAEETTNNLSASHQQWTFYKFGTTKGWVTLRWYGESNGYYSVSVDFEKCDELGRSISD